MPFTDRFGGSTIQPADTGYAAVALTASIFTMWPNYATDPTLVLAKVMNVTPNQAGLFVAMPDATLAGAGTQTIFYNSGSYPYTIMAHDGVTPIATVESGGRRLIVLTDNTTSAGTWIVTLLGVGTGTLDAVGASGQGILPLGQTLNVAFPVTQVSSSRTLTAADRDTVIVWVGGAGTLTLPVSTLFPNFNCEIRNQGTGALTIQGTGGELLDGNSSETFNIQDSAWIHAGAGAWYTVGRGRNANFNFTELVKTVTGGTSSLSLTEASNVVQVYNGVLTANQVVVLPSVVQVYYMSNQTTGTGFSLTFRNPSTGATLSLPQGQNAVVFSDGTNVVNAATTTAGVAQVNYGAGTVSAPSVSVGATNTGLYSPGTGQLGVSISGVQAFVVNATGWTAAISGNAAGTISSSTGSALVVLQRPAGQFGGIQVSSVASPRWQVGVDNAAESGANAGSNIAFYSFSDAGAFIANNFALNRATGNAQFSANVAAVSFTGHLIGNADTATSTTNLNGITGWNYANSSNSPTYLWGSNASNNQFLAATSALSVNFANSATNATNATFVSGQSFPYTNPTNQPTYLWASNGSNNNFLVQPTGMSVNFANSAGSAPAAGGTSAACSGNSATASTAANANALGGIGPGGWVQNAGSVIYLANSGFSQMNANIGGTVCFWGMSFSDETLKENITPATADSLAMIRSMNWVSYNFKKTALHDDIQIDDGHRHEVGGLAQEWEKINPEWVGRATPESPLQPNQMEMLMSAMHAISQQAKIIDELTARIAVLEAA